MEKIPKPIEDFENAWVAAHAEKPLRDIARENWVSEEQKEVLDSIAVSRGEVALLNTLKEEVTEPKIENQIEGHDVLEKIIEVIKHSPDIEFVAAGVGNVLNKPDGGTLGRGSYIFDSKTQKMQYGEMDFLDTSPNGVNADVPFKRQYHGFFIGDKGYITMRLPILARYGNLNNPYLTERRGGPHLTLGIRYDTGKISPLNKEVIDILKNPNSVKDPDGFWDELFDRCAKEFIPNYYNYVLGLVKEYEIQTKK